MHGGNKTKFEMPGDHACTLCGGVDSAEHWMAQCPASQPVTNRRKTRMRIDDYMATLQRGDGLCLRFARVLYWLVKEAPGSGMHRMGMYLREVVEAVFMRLGITQLAAHQITLLRKCALVMTRIWIGGVLEDYSFKMSGKTNRRNVQYEEAKTKQLLKAKHASEAAKLQRDREKLNEAATRQKRLYDYYAMERRDL